MSLKVSIVVEAEESLMKSKYFNAGAPTGAIARGTRRLRGRLLPFLGLLVDMEP